MDLQVLAMYAHGIALNVHQVYALYVWMAMPSIQTKYVINVIHLARHVLNQI